MTKSLKPHLLIVAVVVFISHVAAQSPWKPRMEVAIPTAANSLAYSADGSKLAIGHANGLVTVWNVSDGSKKGEFSVGKLAVKELRFTADASQIVTLADEKTARLWNVADGKAIGEFEGLLLVSNCLQTERHLSPKCRIKRYGYGTLQRGQRLSS